jgi:hypothetical protein
MKYAVVIVLITVLVMAITAVTGGCGESTKETTTTTSESSLPTATGNLEQPGETWQADGVLGDNEYLNEMAYGDYEVRWKADESNIYFGIKAKTEGWLAIGLNPSSQMKDADMIFGAVSNGQTIVSDQFSTGTFGPHSPDAELGGSEDIIEFGGREDGGFTTLEFSRALDTGDSYDNALTKGKIKIIWAYSSSDDFDSQHTSRSSGEITL